jgi:hypothetical protein
MASKDTRTGRTDWQRADLSGIGPRGAQYCGCEAAWLGAYLFIGQHLR